MIRNLLVTTKAYDAHAALRSLRNRIDGTTRIALLCDGALAVKRHLEARTDWYTHTEEEEEEEGDDEEDDDDSVAGWLWRRAGSWSSSLSWSSSPTGPGPVRPPRIHLARTTHAAYRPLGAAAAAAAAGPGEEDGDGSPLLWSLSPLSSPPPQGWLRSGAGVVHAGAASGRTSVEAWPELARTLTEAGLRGASKSTRDIRRELWLQLAAHCCVQPMTALRRQCRNGELMEHYWDDPHYEGKREQIEAVVDEVVRVAAAEERDGEGKGGEGAYRPLSSDEALDFMGQVLKETATRYSAMATDVHGKRRTEVTQLNGHVVSRGMAHGIDCPANERLWRQVETLDQQLRRQQGEVDDARFQSARQVV